MESLEAVLNGQGTPTTEPAPAQPAPTAEPQIAAPVAPSTEPNKEPDPAPAPEPTPEDVFSGKQGKSNKAFAELRASNTKRERILKDIATVLGIQNLDDEESLVTGLQSKILEYRSQAEKIPFDVLKELESAKLLKEQVQSESLKQQATLGFQKVKDTYNLTDKQLTEFAVSLRDAGVNPFQSPVDLLQQYRTLNFDNIIKAAQDKAVQEALARQTKGQTQSTTPVSAQSAPTSPAANVGGMAALNQLLANQK